MNHRVLHVIASLDPSGQASQLAALASGLIAKGHRVRVVALRDGAARGSIEATGATVDLLTQRHRIDPLVASRLRRLAQAWRPSVVHAWDPVAARFAYAAAAGPLVVGVGCRSVPAHGLGGWWDRRADASVACYLAASQPLAETLIASGRGTDRVRTAPRGVAPPSAEEPITREQAFDELGLPPQTRVIAVVSRLTPAKNVRDLIWAADLVRVLNDDARLLIFGDGPVWGELERFARMVGEPGRVRFAGCRQDVRSLLPHCQMLWHAGDESAPPVAVLEAMQAGLPVVADRAPGVGQAVVDQQTGYLVPPAGRAARARVTQQLLEEEDLRAELGSAAKQRAASHFAADTMVDRTIEAYEQVQPESASRLAG